MSRKSPKMRDSIVKSVKIAECFAVSEGFICTCAWISWFKDSLRHRADLSFAALANYSDDSFVVAFCLQIEWRSGTLLIFRGRPTRSLHSHQELRCDQAPGLRSCCCQK